jgi:NAD+ synthase (glutamine-hydrolysing)
MNFQNKDSGSFGYIRVAAASPRTHVADPMANIREIRTLLQNAQHQDVQIAVFPELCISGYTCQDLFFQSTLLDTCFAALRQLVISTQDIPIFYAVGIPLLIKGRLFNCAIVINQGEILGIIPKTYLPNSGEFYEKRWFVSGSEIEADTLSLFDKEIPFGKFLFQPEPTGATIGVEICEDLWSVIPPSSRMALEGANLILNLSASNELVSKAAYRKELVRQQSARCLCTYAYSSCGVHESTTDLVFSGDLMIAENGVIVEEGERYLRQQGIVITDLDLKRISYERTIHANYKDSLRCLKTDNEYTVIRGGKPLCSPDFGNKLFRQISKTPFIPADDQRREENCKEVFSIQTAGLAKRLEHTGVKRVVLGVSGGLDSTLALLVCHKTMQLIGLPPENIVAVSMPGFGTSSSTEQNAQDLMSAMGVTMMKIDIRESCMNHFREINHDPAVHDTTYENVQARERTKILMNLANRHDAIVVGTGDLSELALGWCTYNGDHMSMYAVNSSIPKTLIIYIIRYAITAMDHPVLRGVLDRILDTPISPELLPPDENGQISQKTEDLIGPYLLHDFFLYCFIRKGDSPEKILFLAQKAFEGLYNTDEIHSTLETFFKRFFSQQFKRSCMPDGPKVGSVSLSPRGDWKMPSDASVSAWLDSL